MPSTGRPNVTKLFILNVIEDLRVVDIWSDSPCITWPFSKNNSGYPTFSVGTKGYLANRHIFELFHRVVLGSRKLKSFCAVRACVNPLHYALMERNIDFLRKSVLSLDDDENKHWSNFPCLEWPFQCFPNDYGSVLLEGTREGNVVHRESYATIHGSIPEGIYICHHCDNKKCYRPVHLFAGTPSDNVKDMELKGRSKARNARPSIRGDKHWTKRNKK